MGTDPLLIDKPLDAAEAVEEFGAAEVAIFERVVGDALKGKLSAVRDYLDGWLSLERRLLHHVLEQTPDLLVEHEGRLLFVTMKGVPSSVPGEILELEAIHAPFSTWVAQFGVGKGVALHLLSGIRRSLPKLHPLVPETVAGFPTWDISEREFNRFARLVYLTLTEEQPPLQRIAAAFDLSDTELGALFGVTRQAASQWLDAGVPSSRQARVHAIASIVGLLERNLQSQAIPGVVRTKADAYGGRSILEMLEDQREDVVRAELARVFDWAATA